MSLFCVSRLLKSRISLQVILMLAVKGSSALCHPNTSRLHLLLRKLVELCRHTVVHKAALCLVLLMQTDAGLLISTVDHQRACSGTNCQYMHWLSSVRHICITSLYNVLLHLFILFFCWCAWYLWNYLKTCCKFKTAISSSLPMSIFI